MKMSYFYNEIQHVLIYNVPISLPLLLNPAISITFTLTQNN